MMDATTILTNAAILEKKLGKKVLNAGVCGYGIDQMYLRAEKLIKIFNPKIVILSFLSWDVSRNEFSINTGAGKPYFEIINNTLVRKNVPVPKPLRMEEVDPARILAGHSYLIHKFMMRINEEFWLNWSKWKKVQSNGEKTTCLLISKLEEIAKKSNVEHVYILIQYPGLEADEFKMIDRIKSCIKNIPVQIVDIRPALSKIKNSDQEKFNSLFLLKGKGHPSYAGYTLSANQIYKSIKATQ